MTGVFARSVAARVNGCRRVSAELSSRARRRRDAAARTKDGEAEPMRPDLNSTLTSSAAASRWPRGGLLALGLALIVLTALLTAPAAHAADRIYWSNYDGDSIAYANLNGNGGGGTVNTTGATVAGPMGLTIDPSRGLIYWVNWTGNTGTTISYAHLDGSGGGDLAITGATIDGPHGLAIDPTAGPRPPLLAQLRRQHDLLRRPRRRRRRCRRRSGAHRRDRRRAARGDDRPAHQPPLLVELLRRRRDDDLVGQPRRHRRRRPAAGRDRPARVPRAPRSIPPPGRSTGPTTAIGLCCSTPTSTSVPGSRPSSTAGGDDQWRPRGRDRPRRAAALLGQLRNSNGISYASLDG